MNISDSENDSDIEKEEEIQLAVSPRFNWKDVDQVSNQKTTIL